MGLNPAGDSGDNGEHASYCPPSPWDKDVGEHLLTSYHGGGLLGRQVHANSSYFQCVFYVGSNLQRKPSGKELQLLTGGNLRVGLCGEGECQEGAGH